MVEVDIHMYGCLSGGVKLEFEYKNEALDFIKQFFNLVRNTNDVYLQIAEKDEMVMKPRV